MTHVKLVGISRVSRFGFLRQANISSGNSHFRISFHGAAFASKRPCTFTFRQSHCATSVRHKSAICAPQLHLSKNENECLFISGIIQHWVFQQRGRGCTCTHGYTRTCMRAYIVLHTCTQAHLHECMCDPESLIHHPAAKKTGSLDDWLLTDHYYRSTRQRIEYRVCSQ